MTGKKRVRYPDDNRQYLDFHALRST